MFKIISDTNKPKRIQKLMNELFPLEVAEIYSLDKSSKPAIVMRTASVHKFEVISLSEPGEDSCWTDAQSANIPVYPLERGRRITIELFNKYRR